MNMDSLARLKRIAKATYVCRKCRLYKGAKCAVPGVGPPNAKVMFIGQNPGKKEDETGRPFVGPAGKYLNKVLEKNGIKREEIFITSIVKHTTPGNRMPKDDEVEACMPYTIEQVGIIRPKLMVLMGNLAKRMPRLEGITYVEIVHPAAAFHSNKYKEKFENEVRGVAKRIKALS